ncbi:MAG: ATP-grasp domain-containing protein [Fibrobacter sp.]|uniref:ATP-grasp domain-containing protein n=1 Tax=Fibrobacter sp. TaxID=35828 RepID=UPI0025C5AF52|nr:ATP-grasp domain-containing protein [Fibrobacter sp.]MBQ7080909.1 ATP-grasp domain-containing protein [Fibrobacter sp.]
MKKLMLLGGIRYLLPVIEAAHKQGYYVITCDYIPGNMAHKYSDEYVNVSIVDKDAVLRVAQEKQIDGIMSFGVDPGVIAAAYVQEKMGLPAFGPYESVRILQNKDLFRKFLTENGFVVPKAKGFSSMEEALADLSWYEFPVIVKPTDSAGSKGVTRVDSENALRPALEHAFANSISGNVIVEEFIEKMGCSSDSDSFSLNGKLVFCSFSAQRFDENAAGPYVPAAYSWPSTFGQEYEMKLRAELQRLLTLLGMKTSVYNIETRIGKNGKPYIMEVSPRGGGNRLSEMLRYATGVDLITACTRAAVGDPVENVEQKPYKGHWAEVILHADREGFFAGLSIAKEIEPYVVERNLWVKEGDHVKAFNGANNAIGTLVFNFPEDCEMENFIASPNRMLKVVIK